MLSESLARRERVLLVTVAGFFTLLGLLWHGLASWHVLDDALIHLRYAKHLAEGGILSYDGAAPSYGTSSPGYVALLSLGYRLLPTALLPKLVSVLGWAGLLAFGWRRLLATGHREARLVWLALLVLLCMPFGVRWLADGMETSLVVLGALLLSVTAAESVKSPGGARVVALAVGGAALTLLRVECLGLCLALSLSLGVMQRAHWTAARLRMVLAPAAGGAAAVCVLVLLTGHLVSDAALAKQSSTAAGFMRFWLRAHASSAAFGLGIPALTLTVLARLWMLRPTVRPALLVVGSIPLGLALAGMLGGQLIHGVRYFIWAWVAALAWGACELSRGPEPRRALRLTPVVAVAALALCAHAVEAMVALPIMRARGETLRTMVSHEWKPLSGRRGLAFDVGHVGWFSNAALCDPLGIVNGRTFAKLPRHERLVRCVEGEPDFWFVTPGQLRELRALSPLPHPICRRYAFPNVGGPDPHLLIVRPELASAMKCEPVTSHQPPG